MKILYALILVSMQGMYSRLGHHYCWVSNHFYKKYQALKGHFISCRLCSLFTPLSLQGTDVKKNPQMDDLSCPRRTSYVLRGVVLNLGYGIVVDNYVKNESQNVNILRLARKKLRQNWIYSMTDDLNIECKVEKLDKLGPKLCELLFS